MGPTIGSQLLVDFLHQGFSLVRFVPCHLPRDRAMGLVQHSRTSGHGVEGCQAGFEVAELGLEMQHNACGEGAETPENEEIRV